MPADKAGNNIISVCKYYYMHTLMEELGINSGSTINSTYEKQDVTVDEIIRTHTTTLENIFHITNKRRKICQKYIGYQNFTRHRAKHVLLQVQVHAPLLRSLN